MFAQKWELQYLEQFKKDMKASQGFKMGKITKWLDKTSQADTSLQTTQSQVAAQFIQQVMEITKIKKINKSQRLQIRSKGLLSYLHGDFLSWEEC